ncbi:FG-GAP repeat domain-containing protein [Streptomyces sp. NPDC050085]|uniref:FG-GAP repeat domain-containing protein n=1 Tax=Streptomyces sp. NPDC050085 TaxID=3365600 RepID=UPI0037BD6D60
MVLAAGMALAGPAGAADNDPASHTVTEPSAPTFTPPSDAMLKHRASGSNKLRAAVDAPAPRFDIDGDGLADSLYQVWNNKTYIRYGAPNTDDVEFTVYTSRDEQTPARELLTPGDLDGDPSTHEVLSLSASGRLSLHMTNSLTGTGDDVWSGSGWQMFNKVTAPGDVTGDGKADLLARTPSGQLYLYKGTGSATYPFKDRVIVGSGWGQFDQLLGVGDMNSDGLGDIVARTPSGDLYFYGGKGSESVPLKPRVKIGYGWQGYNQLAAVGDDDADGNDDIVARTTSGTLYLYESDGTGKFKPRLGGGTGWNPITAFANSGSDRYIGKRAVVAMDKYGSLWQYNSTNNGWLGARQKVSDQGGFYGASLFYASSLDGDGYGDLIERYEGKLYNLRTGTQFSGWSNYNLVLGPGDLSGDGNGDLLARSKAGDLWLFRGYGTGTQLTARSFIGGGWNQYKSILGAGDISGDGRADIVARTTSGNLYLYKGTGDRNHPFSSRVKIGYGWTYSQLDAPGDIDGDGRADLLAVNSKGELFRYSSNGTGGFKAKAKIGTGWNAYSHVY